MTNDIAFFDFTRYHGKHSQTGSTTLRVHNLIKYWPEAHLYKYGELPGTLIFQKVYITEDYKFPAHVESKRILDICDPDWFDGTNIVETCAAMDAVVVPTEPLAEFIRQFHNKVVVIPDRFDLEVIPKPIKHEDEARRVVWFGYMHNAVLMKQAMRVIDELNLNLTVIAEDDPYVHQWSKRDHNEYYTFKKYKEETIYQELQKADFCILPEGNRPRDPFKSNNKTIKANLAGLPVAKTADDVHHYMKAENRQKWFESAYATIRKDYDVKRSVEDYKRLIDEIST